MSKKKIFLIIGTFLILFLISGCGKQPIAEIKKTDDTKKSLITNQKPDLAVDESGLSKEIAVITTKKGEIKFKFYSEDAPNTVNRIMELINSGFYDGLTFHRVEPGFVIQGGDPLGKGTGGSGQNIKAEFNSRKHLAGTVAMARAADPNSADSQFYITLATQPFLDGKYTVFGQVVEGMEVVQQIAKDDVMERVYLETAKEQKTEESAEDIFVKNPNPNDVVSSPLKIEGRALGSWFFEAVFPVKLLDENGDIISHGPAQAQGNWMTDDFVPFKAELEFSAGQSKTGTLVLEQDNPSGLPGNVAQIQIPVKF